MSFSKKKEKEILISDILLLNWINLNEMKDSPNKGLYGHTQNIIIPE
jgi:hypothetical protein